MHVSLAHRTINRALGLTLFLLVGLGVGSELALNVYNIRDTYELILMTNLSYEGNLPTWYSSLLLWSCALVLFVIAHLTARSEARYAWHWRTLGIIFVYISLDEAVMIHETINSPLREALALDGIFYFAWVVPFACLVVVLLLAYLRFLLNLPRLFRVSFVLAGAVYVGGALGTELPISAWYAAHGGDNLVYGLLNLGQESLEMLGASIFLSALLGYLSATFGTLTIQFRDVRS